MVIVRTYSAGVHYGDLVSRNGQEVTLTNSRKLWSWDNRFTLNEIANRGLSEASKISEPVKSVLLLQAIEIIDVDEEAAKQMREFPSFKIPGEVR